MRRRKNKVWLGVVGPLLVGLLACGDGVRHRETVTILHWNDFHAQNRPFVDLSQPETRPLVGGAPRFAFVLDSLRDAVRNPVMLHAGDEFSGSAECTITKGESQIRLLNLLRPNALELGNHEFDYGASRLLKLLRQLRPQVVCSNLLDKTAGRPFGGPRVRPYILLKVGRARVAVIGTIRPGFVHVSVSGGRVESLDPEAAVKKWAAALADSADLTVVLSHMGYNADVRMARELGTRYVDVIIGGHSHTVMGQPERVNGVVICQAGDRGRFIGKLVLEVDLDRDAVSKWRGELVPVRNPGSVDSTVAVFLDSLDRALEPVYHLNEVVAELRGDWIRDSRGECNIGDWQADAFRKVAGSDVAFQNTYGIRKDLPAGPIRVRDFWEMNPFSNQLVTFSVTGAELVRILEHNCGDGGELLQVSGVRCVCDLSRPKGRRLASAVLADGSPIAPERTYTVCTNDYVAKNFYRYFGIPPKDRPIRRLGIIDRDALIRVAREQKIIEARKDGRLVIRR